MRTESTAFISLFPSSRSKKKLKKIEWMNNTTQTIQKIQILMKKKINKKNYDFVLIRNVKQQTTIYVL